MKKILWMIVMGWLVIPSFAQTCLPEGIVLETQGQVDSFSINYPGCKVIEGDVYCGGQYNGYNKSIFNLHGLSQLEAIDGNFDLMLFDYLEDFSGLDNLSRVGGTFRIAYQDFLKNIKGLNSLDTVEGDLRIEKCKYLKGLEGLDSLKYVGGSLYLLNDDDIEDLGGLGSLRMVKKNLKVSFHDNLKSFNGIDSLRFVGNDLEIRSNLFLEDLQGLNNLELIKGHLRITGNYALWDISALENVVADSIKDVFFSDDLEIQHNPELAVCNNQMVCRFLSLPGKTYSISDNKVGCNSADEIICPVSVFDVEKTSFLVFPNPSDDYISLNWGGATQVLFMLYDGIGQEMAKLSIEHYEPINISFLPKGIYGYQILDTTGALLGVGKLVKQ